MTAGDNWRDTLFVWDGILTINEEKKDGKDKDEQKEDPPLPVEWVGTWIGCEDCADATKAEAPMRGVFDAFVESDMQFSVKGTAAKIKTPTVSDGKSPCLASFLMGDGWDLGEGDEKKKHKDDVHDVYFANLKWSGDLRDLTNNLIFATGKNNHGPFISAGWMRPGNRVTLARRYLQEEDYRVKWDMDDLRKAVIEGIVREGKKKIRIPSWQCTAMHAEEGASKKKRKREMEKAKEEEPKKEEGNGDKNEGEAKD